MSMYSKDEDGVISKYLNRRISIRISSFILSRWENPNPYVATVISFLAGVFSAFAYVRSMSLLGGIFFQLTSILDGVDGELARATGRAGPLGAFIDTMSDRLIDFIVLLSIYYVTFLGYRYRFMEEIVYFVCFFAWFMVSYYHSFVRGIGSDGVVLTGVMRFASRDVRIFIVFLFSLVGFAVYGVYLSGFVAMTYLFFFCHPDYQCLTG